VKSVAIGVDIGGTKIHWAVMDREGRLLHSLKQPTPSREGAEAILRAVAEGIAQMEKWLLAQEDGWICAGIGIGSAGQINFETGVVEYAVDTIWGWKGAQIKQTLARRFPYPIYVDNDVNAIAIAEQMYGAGRRYRHFVCLALGTGVGGAIVASGSLVRGAYGGAGELGHLTVDFNGPRCSCGNYGCLELYASGTGISRVAQEWIARNDWKVSWRPDSREVIAAWLAGDQQASEVMAYVIGALSSGISSLIHTLNPEAVIIGGGVAETGSPLLNAIRSEAARRTGEAMWRAVEVLPATVGSNAGVIGAAAQVWSYGDDVQTAQ